MKEKIIEAVKKAREKAKKRKFVQSFDLIISLKDIDLKKPENRFVEDVVLPNGRGKEAKVVLFSDTIKNVDCEVIKGKEIEVLGKDKRSAKKLVKNTDFFLAEPSLMPLIGKYLGQYMGPRGKLPKIIRGEDVQRMVENYKRSVRIKLKDSPVIQCLVGNEEMEDEKIAENIETVLKVLEGKLPKGFNNVRKVYVKLTMGSPVKIEVV